MRVATRLSLVSLALLVLLLPGVPVTAANALSYAGTYDWSGGERGRLDVAFMPDGEGGWDVTFRFSFSRRTHTWKGTAVGDLDGSLEGTVERRRGTYRFVGTFEDGVFVGKHYQVSRSGKLHDTGSLMFE